MNDTQLQPKAHGRAGFWYDIYFLARYTPACAVDPSHDGPLVVLKQGDEGTVLCKACAAEVTAELERLGMSVIWEEVMV